MPNGKFLAANHANVTFEVDEIDQLARAGWSVLVRGVGRGGHQQPPHELVQRTHASGVEPWAPIEHGC